MDGYVLEAVVVAHVIVMMMRIDYGYGLVDEVPGEFLDIADAHAGIQEDSTLSAHDEIRDHLLRMIGLGDGPHILGYAGALKPIAHHGPKPLWTASSTRSLDSLLAILEDS